MTRRILLLITDLERGGTPTVVRELAIRLRDASRATVIEVACLSKWGPVADELRDAGVAVSALGATGPADLLVTLWRLIRLIRRQKYDTVFSFLLHANFVAAAASLRLHDVRWIQSIQTTQPDPRWHWQVQRLAQHAAEVVVVPSPSAARAAADWAGVPEEKLVVIPNAIDVADWASSTPREPGECFAAGEPYPITFLGRLDPIKDVPTLLKAVGLLGGLVKLDVYGDGQDRPRIEALIAAENLRNRVTLHGAVDRPQTALAGSGMLVLPSLAEGFGLVLIEAMTAGVPVIATDVAGIWDVVRNGQTGLLVPPGDAAGMAAAIRSIVSNSELRRRLTTAARSDVQSRFSWEIILAKYQAVLQI